MNSDKTFEFISLIQERPQLWKEQHKEFMNRDVRAKMFREVSEASGLSEETCKKKLKSLKDKMRDVTSKLPKTKSGQPAFQLSEEFVRWPYYKALLFMKDQFIGRDLSGTYHDENDRAVSVISSVDSDEEILQIPMTQQDPSTSSSAVASPVPVQDCSSTWAHQPKTKKARMAEDFLALEKEKISNLKKIIEEPKEVKDEWDIYSSIACDLRKLRDPFLIMQAKTHINKIVGDSVLQQLQKDTGPRYTTTSTAGDMSYDSSDCYRSYESV